MTKYESCPVSFTFKCENDITESEYASICVELTEELRGKIELERKWGSGGFRITRNDKFRLIRHSVHVSKTDSTSINWPWISDNTFENWKSSKKILWPKGAVGTMNLLADSVASHWTINDFSSLMSVIVRHDNIKINKVTKQKFIKGRLNRVLNKAIKKQK